MEAPVVVSVPSPEDESFVEKLPEETKTLIETALSSESPLLSLEIALKRHVLLQAIPLASGSLANNDNIGSFWTQILHFAVHVLTFGNKDDDADESKSKGPQIARLFTPLLSGIRKLPILILEDLTDMLPTPLAQSFWTLFVIPNYSILFGDVLWQTKPNTCALPLLKLTQKLLRRLDNAHFKAEILGQLAKVYPLSEKSANQLFGSHNEDQTVLDSLEDFEKDNTSTTATTDGPLVSTAVAATKDYSVYQNFWKLQKDLANPNGIHVADFLQRSQTVITALEGGGSSHQTLTTTDEGGSLRYLTNARLLPIQVESVEFTTHILTQFCIVAHHLLLQVPKLQAQVQPLVTRAHKVLESAAASNNADYLPTLQHVLQTEVTWRQWKQQKCPATIDAIKEEPPPCRRRLGGTLGDDDDDDNANKLESLTNVRKNLATYSSQLGSKAPPMDQFLEPYVQALDPEAGIEAEYHPGRSAPFGWRALRLMTAEHLGDFSLLHASGNYETLVRTIYETKGEPIPGIKPSVPEDEGMVPQAVAVKEQVVEKPQEEEEGKSPKEENEDAMDASPTLEGDDKEEGAKDSTSNLEKGEEEGQVTTTKTEESNGNTTLSVEETAKESTDPPKPKETKKEPVVDRSTNKEENKTNKSKDQERRPGPKRLPPPDRRPVESSQSAGNKRARSPIQSPSSRMASRDGDRNVRPRDGPRDGPRDRGGRDGPRDGQRSRGPSRGDRGEPPRDRRDGPPPPQRDRDTSRGGRDRRDNRDNRSRHRGRDRR